jgi:hypothetical protein
MQMITGSETSPSHDLKFFLNVLLLWCKIIKITFSMTVR